MTREEIIQGLQFTIDMFLTDPLTGEPITKPRNNMDKTTIDACKGAIELLTQEPCEDAISRAEVLSIYDEWFATCDISDKKASPKAKIKALPSVQPKPKTGHWISYWDEEARCYVYKCPECGNKQPFDTKYCWECGTKLSEISTGSESEE